MQPSPTKQWATGLRTWGCLAVLGLALLGGCGADVPPATTPCVGGATQPCSCSDGDSGTQTCTNGAFGVCSCPSTQDAGPDGGVLDGATGTDTAEPSDSAAETDSASVTDAAAGTDAAAETDVAAGPATCTSDKDCKDAGQVCDPLTKACVACLSDAECSPGQHCVGLACQTYTACTNSLGCTAAQGPDGNDQPICDQGIGECTACLTAADCPVHHDCLAKACVPYVTCQNSTDCGPDEVCNKVTSRCVQCLGNNDCSANQLCEAGQCRDFVPCSSDKQCTDKGLLCDQTKGKCAQCLAHTDCPAIYHCQNAGVDQTGLCVLDVCAQGQGACSNNAKVTCNAVGDAYGAPVACPAQTTCAAPGGMPECLPWAGPYCAITLSLSTVNFGLLPPGTQKVLTLGMKNSGSGVCEFQSVKVTDCVGSGLPAQGTQPNCNTGGSTKFQAYGPSANLFALQPGDTGTLSVAVTAPEDLGLFGAPNQLTPLFGLIVTEFKDKSSGALYNYPDVKIYDPTSVKAAKPNIEAKVGKAPVTVLPGNVDFAVTTEGCKAPSLEVGVYNTGTTEVFVNKLELQGCGVEVQPDSWPGIPETGLPVSKANPTKFKVKYAPKNDGADQCQLGIWTSLSGVCTTSAGAQTGVNCNVNGGCGTGEFCAGQLFTVPIKGEGTFDTDFTDEFIQGVGKKVDVLFVIDDSGSMSEEQSNLSNNFSKFVQTADIWKNDYHIGVVTTDMDDGSKMGKLQEKSGYRVVTPTTPNGTSVLQNMAKQGTSGSGTEEGLSAAEAAITAPLTTDLGKACNADADCSSPAKCIPDADDPAVKGCGGTNRTFLRKNAGLEVVILSDEDDGSAADINYYTNFFYSVKGLANKNLFHLHAIVGPKPNGCQTSAGDAVSGDRYIAVANNTGGNVASICEQNFASALQAIGTVAFGLAQQFFLTRTPEPNTIEVKINGVVCATTAQNWEYDEASNSVTFVQNSACMPKEGDKVSIYYKMACLP